MNCFHGYDLSANHAGAVELDAEAGLTWFRYVTSVQKAARRKSPLGRGVYIPVPKMKRDCGKDADAFLVQRLVWWGRELEVWLQARRPTHVAIEGYAFGAKGHKHQTGEIGGLARYLVLQMAEAKLRLHNPMDVKLFSAHDGDPDPEALIGAVVRRWWPGLPEVTDDQTALGDLADAYTLARMAWTEDALRTGRLTMGDLHPEEIRVFNKATRANPINVLGRRWLEVEAPGCTTLAPKP